MSANDILPKPANSSAISSAPEPERYEPERYDPAAIESAWQQRWSVDPALYASDPADSGKP